MTRDQPGELDPWLNELRASGYRLTATRLAVVSTLRASREPLAAPQVHAQAMSGCPGLGLATVYRTLEKLEALGLVQRVHDRCGCHQYIAAGHAAPPVVICQRCGRQVTVDAALCGRLLQMIAFHCGVEVHDYLMQFNGLCSECR